MNNLQTETNTQTFRQRKITQAGWVLMIASIGLWALIPVLPFLPYSNAERAGALAVILVSAEIVFWLGAMMAGADAVRRMKSWWSGSSPSARAVAAPVAVDTDLRTGPL